jgi:hypothetical protein
METKEQKTPTFWQRIEQLIIKDDLHHTDLLTAVQFAVDYSYHLDHSPLFHINPIDGIRTTYTLADYSYYKSYPQPLRPETLDEEACIEHLERRVAYVDTIHSALAHIFNFKYAINEVRPVSNDDVWTFQLAYEVSYKGTVPIKIPSKPQPILKLVEA